MINGMSWWKRLWRLVGPRSLPAPVKPSPILTPDQMQLLPSGLRVTQTPEPSTLIDKLRYVGAMNHGSFFPSWMIDENGSWGVKLSKICNDAADELERWHKRYINDLTGRG